MGKRKGRLLFLGLVGLALSCGAASRGAAERPGGEPALHASGAPFEDPETGLWGYHDQAGRVVLPARYPLATPFNERGVAAAVLPEGWRWIDPQGRPLLRPFVVDNFPDEPAEGLARFVGDRERLGFADASARVVIPARYVFVGAFSDGRAAFCQGCRPVTRGEITFYKGGRWGYLDRSGAQVIPARYDEANPFEGGRARVLAAERERAPILRRVPPGKGPGGDPPVIETRTWLWIDPEGRETSPPPDEPTPPSEPAGCDCEQIAPPPEAFEGSGQAR